MGAEPALRRSLEQPLSRINEPEKPVLSGPPQECGERLFRVVFSRSVEPAAAYISDYETSISGQIPAVRRPREPPWLSGSATVKTGHFRTFSIKQKQRPKLPAPFDAMVAVKLLSFLWLFRLVPASLSRRAKRRGELEQRQR